MENLSQYLALKGLAVLLIDMQDYFLTPKKRELIPNHISVMHFCKENSIPLLVVEFSGYGETTYLLKKELARLPHSNVFYFQKSDNDAFSNQDVVSLLRKKGVKTLLLMGINAAYCVYATAQTAINLGYNIITSEDLIAGYQGNDEPHCNGPEWYEENGIYFRKYKEIIQSVN